eukprot:scaffold183929_cov30-Tisochrysis_lutea.AAC.3
MKAIVTGNGCGAASCGGSLGTRTPLASSLVLRLRIGPLRTVKADVEYSRSATTCASSSMPRRAIGRLAKSFSRMPWRPSRCDPSGARSRHQPFCDAVGGGKRSCGKW